MTPRFAHAMLAAVTLALSGAAANAAQGIVPATQNSPSPDACNRTIQAMGASMGFKELPGEKPALLFTVRVNGLDYTALCDAETGTVKDVSRKMTD